MEKQKESCCDEDRSSILEQNFATPKRKINKEKILASLKKNSKREPEIERRFFLQEDVPTVKHFTDKGKSASIGMKLLGGLTEMEEESLCSQKQDDLFTKKEERKPTQEEGKKLCTLKKAIPEKLWEEQTRSANREQNIDYLVKYIKSQMSLICIGSKNLYIFGGKVYEDISERKRAATYFKQVLNEETSRLFRDYSEIHNQLLSDPEIAFDSLEQLPINRDVVVFQNGTYNVREQIFYKNQFWEKDYIFSILATDYDCNDFSEELNSKYATGELVGIKVCADEDVATNKPLKSEDVALIKKITSSDKIRTRQIYRKAVQLRPDCKLVWAENGMLTFATSEDLQPLINRFIIFPLDVPIPKDERDPDILSRLLAGRNYMIKLALEALHNLVEKRFCFSEVVDAEDYFNPRIFHNGVEEFVESECQLESDAVAYTQELYAKYHQFCKRNSEYKALSTNQLIPYLKGKYGVKKYTNGSKRGVRGIRLLDIAPD
ncbi:MAG: hypothetical protein HFI74_12055 [Lachnospiraceae bacterium]|jgi:hypothetical protein|nr:hypothetical protein [Lachnospiraceae bacterium]